MDNIIEKLKNLEYNEKIHNKFNLQEIQKLLELYLIISKQEESIFELIYHYHGCDSFEDIFRDYDSRYLEDKTVGVEIALKSVIENIQYEKDKKDKKNKKDK